MADQPVYRAAEKYDHAYEAYARLSRDHVALLKRNEEFRAEVSRIADEMRDTASYWGDTDTGRRIGIYADLLGEALDDAAIQAIPTDQTAPPAGVLAEIAAERARQDAKWGQQNHPDGTGPDVPYVPFTATDMTDAATAARLRCEANGSSEDNWRDILTEEVYEAYAEEAKDALRAELIQVAAVAVAWVEAIDRRTSQTATDGRQDGTETQEDAVAALIEPYGWLSRGGGPWEPATREEWITAEREAGFNAPKDEPATAGFSSAGDTVRGRRRKPNEGDRW